MAKTKIRKKIEDAVIRGIRRNAERIFNLSQSTSSCYVPIDKGFLSHSGYKSDTDKGSEIGYRAPYSHDVEFGAPEKPITGTQIVKVKSHKVRSYKRKDGVVVPSYVVPAHEKKYVNKRLIGFRPKFSKFERGKLMFRVIDKIAEKKPQLFLTRAVRDGIPFMPEDIAFELKRSGIGRVQG